MRTIPNTLKMVTPIGVIKIKLDFDRAPITSNYFRELAELGGLNMSSFFRVVTTSNNSYNPSVPIEVVQGGRTDDQLEILPPVSHEATSLTGLTHKKWSVSLARYGIGETYGSFFIAMRDEPALDFGGNRHPDGQGFAVFGQVISGHDVIERIYAQAEQHEYLKKKVEISSITVS